MAGLPSDLRPQSRPVSHPHQGGTGTLPKAPAKPVGDMLGEALGRCGSSIHPTIRSSVT